jgi:hypothetical protein
MTQFTSIPVDQFPLNWHAYNDLMDRIRDAARGFAKLGTPSGDVIDQKLMDVHALLNRTWELIQDIERRELAE